MTSEFFWLLPLGIAVGAYGTLIGAGGGFVLMPVLILMYPHMSPATMTGISLTVVFFNALSGSGAYSRLRRIDYRSGLLFAACTVPGAVLGSYVIRWVPRSTFDLVFGIVLSQGSVFLMIVPRPRNRPLGPAGAFTARRLVIDASGARHEYTFNWPLGAVISVFVGFISSILGIGGGIVHVPAMVYVLSFPPHLATATSHFVLAVMTLAGSSVHVAGGDLDGCLHQIIPLAIGAMAGAQLGAKLSCRIRARWILRGLALALGLVGVRILILAL